MHNLEPLIERVADWNRKRECTNYDCELEMRMLLEEMLEVLKADNVVDKLHESADVLFVFFGTCFKADVSGKILSAEFIVFADALENLFGLLAAHTDSFVRQVYGVSELPNFEELQMKVLDAVITANELKPTEKVNGKIVKGDKYVSPRAKIAELVKAWERENELC